TLSLSTLLTASDRLLLDDVDQAVLSDLRFLLDEKEDRAPEALARVARAAVAGLARANLLQHAVADPAGGLPSLVKICIVRERLARAHGLADLAFAMQGLGTIPIALAGTPEQRA